MPPVWWCLFVRLDHPQLLRLNLVVESWASLILRHVVVVGEGNR